MELKEVIGWRRSVRFYWPYRPVERAKIQKMQEAARRASCVGNVNNTRAIVVWRDKASRLDAGPLGLVTNTELSSQTIGPFALF